MALFLTWKVLNETQIQYLELETDSITLRSKLAEYLLINFTDQRKSEIAVDFHLQNYIFCKKHAFDGRRTSTFMSMMSETLAVDSAAYSPAQTRTSSFASFQKLLLMHSIERSPVSIQVFDEDDLQAIIKFVTDRYYRQYNLYKYVFSSKMRLEIAQCLPMEVEEPLLVMQSLNSGVQIAEVLEPVNPDFSEKNGAIELIESS